ncbi:MMPL family transporter [Kytococcus sedentarius]|uniref:MMPL family transporter n=1 Tax=Kytococcus sedentarius TaxID=1276 RepID=UPI0035BBB7F2
MSSTRDLSFRGHAASERPQGEEVTGPARLLTGRWTAPLVALLMVLLAGAAMGLLPGSSDAGGPTSLPEGADSAEVTRITSEFPGGDVVPAVVVVESDEGELGREALGALGQKGQELLSALPEDAVSQDAQVQGPIPSEDGQAALLVVPLDADAMQANGPDIVEDLRGASDGLAPGTTSYVTGAAGFSADVAGSFEGADFRLLAATAVVVAVLLLITYRSPVLWLVPLIVIGLADRVAATVSGTVNEAADLAFDGSTSGITSVLVFGAGTNYALLLVSRYRDELRDTPDHRLALARAWRAALPAILASNITVVLTVALLLLAVQPSNRALGLSTGVGLLVALLFALTLLPALLALFGRGLFWPFVPRPGDRDRTRSGIWHRIATAVVRRPAVVLAASVVLLGVMALGLVGTKVGLSQTDQFRVEAESVTGLEALEEHFPSGAATPLSVLVPVPEGSGVQADQGGPPAGEGGESGPPAGEGGESGPPAGEGGGGEGPPAPELAEPAADVVAALEGVEGVTGVQPQASATVDGTTWQQLQVTSDAAPASAEARRVVEDVRSAASGATEGTLVGGSEAQAVDQRAGVLRDMTVVIPLMLVMILVVLVIVLRSLVAPVLLVIISVVGSLAAMGAGALLSEHVFGFPALDISVPLYSFLFLVALGIDYTIFLVVRAREELVSGRERTTASAMVRAVAATGGVITSAGIVLAAVFVVLGVLPLITLTQVGIVVGLGILVDTFLVRTVVVPAVFDLVGDKVWWPARPGQQAGARAQQQAAQPEAEPVHR